MSPLLSHWRDSLNRAKCAPARLPAVRRSPPNTNSAAGNQRLHPDRPLHWDTGERDSVGVADQEIYYRPAGDRPQGDQQAATYSNTWDTGCSRLSNCPWFVCLRSTARGGGVAPMRRLQTALSP